MLKTLVNKLRVFKRIPWLGPMIKKAYWMALRLLPRATVERIYSGHTDWKKIDDELAQFWSSGEKGITETTRNPRIIVSLTSFPPRIPRIHYTISTLLKQTLKPDRIVLWLAEEQFPNRNDDLSPELLAMLDRGLSIRYTHDTKSYKKLIPAIAEFPDDIIVTVDDDLLYESNLLEKLVRSHESNPDAIHANRAHRITANPDGTHRKYTEWKHCIGKTDGCFRNFLTSGGGTLFSPHSLHEDVSNERFFMEIAPSADDIWFWAMAVLRGTKIYVVENSLPWYLNHPPSYEEIFHGPSGLEAINVIGGQNDVQFNRVLERYPIIAERLRQEIEESRAQEIDSINECKKTRKS